MFERFTSAARTAVVQAQEDARRLGHDHIAAEHLLVALLQDGDGAPAQVLAGLGVDRDRLDRDLAVLGHADADADALAAIGIDLDAVRRQAESSFGADALTRPRPRRRGLFRRQADHIPFTASARQALEQSLRQALALGHNEIRVEHLLLGLVADDEASAARTLRRLGADPAEVRERTRARLTDAA